MTSTFAKYSLLIFQQPNMYVYLVGQLVLTQMMTVSHVQDNVMTCLLADNSHCARVTTLETLSLHNCLN